MHMKMKEFHSTVAAVFLAVATVHFLRAVTGTSLMFGDTLIPMWASWLAVVVALYLGYNAYKLRP